MLASCHFCSTPSWAMGACQVQFIIMLAISAFCAQLYSIYGSLFVVHGLSLCITARGTAAVQMLSLSCRLN